MAASITFDFLSRGAGQLQGDVRKLGDNTVLAARGARVLSDAIEKLGKKEDRTAAESAILAKALRQTGDAEDRVAARAVLADAAIRRLDDAMKDSTKSSGGLRKALGGLKLNPGLLGPALLLAPAMTTLAGVAAGAAAGLGGAFIAGGLALSAFGAVAKPVLGDAQKAAQAVAKAQDNYTIAIANGTKKSVAYKAEQVAIAKAYAGMSPAQIALSRQLGDMASAWDKVKAAQTPVVAGALQPWLKSVTGLTKNLPPVIGKVSPVIAGLGTQFDHLINSSAFRGFRDFIGSTGSAAVSAGGSTIIDLVKSFMILLPKADPLIREAVGWISRLGPAVLTWASSKKASDDITRFMQWFSKNGPAVGGLLRNIGGALKALAPGLTSGGALELKIISDFLGWVAKLPPAVAKPLTEVAGAALILSKLGVLKVGLQIVGPAVKWLSGGLINLGGGAAAGAEIRAAMVSGGAAAAAEIRAAMAGGGAAAGAGGAAGSAGAGAAGGTAAGGGFVAAFRAALSPALAGVVAGALIRAAGDTLSPAGSFAGRLNAQFQADGHLWSTSLLHSFTFGGLEAWMTTHFGQPVGGFLNKATGFLSGSWGKFTGFLSGSWNQTWGQITGRSAQGSRSVGDSLAAAGRSADNLRTRNLVPLQGEFGKVTGGIQGLAGTIQGTMLNALRAAGARSDAIRTQNLIPLRGELGKVSGGVQGLQASIDRMHGKTVNVGVHASGSGGMTFTQKVAASISSGGFSLRGLASGGRLPGFGGGDQHLTLLESGEAVVDKQRTRRFAPVLKAMGVPGMASGGIAGTVPWAAGREYDFARSAEAGFLRAEYARLKAAVGAAANAALGFALIPGGGSVGPAAAAAQAWARAQLASGIYGWGLSNWPPLLNLWTGESGWRWNAQNPTSPAYGIPQADPGYKMAAAGADWRTNPVTQMRWGLAYIRSAYGSPSTAWADWQSRSPHWYGSGLDAVFRHPAVIGVGERGPERVRVQPLAPAGRGGAAVVRLEITGSGHGGFDAFLLKWIRENVRIKGGGSVQAAFGR